MAKLRLTVACDNYDYLQPLRDGRVQAEGIDLNLITVESGIRHQRMYHHGEYDACEFSKRLYNEFMQQSHRLSFAWARSYFEEERKFFGKDPFYQGLRENRHDVQTMIQFAQEQGMLARPLTVEEIFTENTRNT